MSNSMVVAPAASVDDEYLSKLQQQHKVIIQGEESESSATARDAGRAGAMSCRMPGGSVVPSGFRAMGVQITPWKPDNTKCYVCEDKFTWFNHRHKCRNCYEYVCHPCSLKRKVLRAYTSPKRVCDICVDKFWAGAQKETDAATYSAEAPPNNTENAEKSGARLSLTVPAEGCPLDGPATGPMSLSPSTPVVYGAFFSLGSSAGKENRNTSAPMSSPLLLASTPEGEEEEEEEAGADEACSSPPGTYGASGAFFGDDSEGMGEEDEEDGKSVAVADEVNSVNYDGDDEGSDRAFATDAPACPVVDTTVAVAPTLDTCNEHGLEQRQGLEEEKDEKENLLDRDRQLASVVREEQDENDHAAEVEERQSAAIVAVERGQGQKIEATVVLLALAAAALPSVMQQAMSSAAATNTESNKTDERAGDDSMVSFAVGLGWGLVAAGIGFGVAALFRRM